MYILQLSDFWLNIGESLEQLFNQIGDWNWNNILEYFQNVSLGTVAITILTLFVKFVIPLLKNSNNKILKAIGSLLLEVKNMKKENQTVSNILAKYMSLQSEVNLTSKTLSDEHKELFKQLATEMRAINNEQLNEMADNIDEIIEDGKIDADEVIELAESTETGKKILDYNINDIIPKEEANE